MSDKRGFLSGVVAAALALVVMAGLTLSAQAATLYITEYANAISQIGTTSPQILPAPPLRVQTVAIGGGSTSSVALGAGTKAVTLTCDIGCSIVIGTTPTATTVSTLQQQGQTVTYGVVPGNVVAVIANTAGDLPGGGSGGTENVNLAQVAGTNTVTGGVSGLLAVAGNTASGVTDAGNPVKVGCIFSSALPTVTAGQRVDCQASSAGALLTAGGALTGADGISNSLSGAYNFASGTNARLGAQALFAFNGATWDRQFTCPSTAAISVTAGNTTQLVALSGTTVIRVCSFVTSISLTGTATFVYGTGANCASGTTSITGAMNILTGSSLALSAGNGSIFRALAANALCLTAATGNVTGFVTYAQY